MKYLVKFMEFREISLNHAKDTGLALTLILLILIRIYRHNLLNFLAIGLVILTMVCPIFFKPLAYAWFNLSHVLGTIVSKILLTIIFLIIVTPIGFITRIFGMDSMRKKAWKNKKDTLLIERNHLFSSQDLENPY